MRCLERTGARIRKNVSGNLRKSKHNKTTKPTGVYALVSGGAEVVFANVSETGVNVPVPPIKN